MNQGIVLRTIDFDKATSIQGTALVYCKGAQNDFKVITESVRLQKCIKDLEVPENKYTITDIS
jgi:hypothetical protein